MGGWGEVNGRRRCSLSRCLSQTRRALDRSLSLLQVSEHTASDSHASAHKRRKQIRRRVVIVIDNARADKRLSRGFNSSLCS